MLFERFTTNLAKRLLGLLTDAPVSTAEAPLLRATEVVAASGEPTAVVQGTTPAAPTAGAADPQAEAEAAWAQWGERVRCFIEGAPFAPAIEYKEVRAAALGRIPDSLFRANLARMSIADWSAVVIESLPYPGGSKAKGPGRPPVGPAWASLVGLYFLGFNLPPDQDYFGVGRLSNNPKWLEALRLRVRTPILGVLVVEKQEGLVELSGLPGRMAILRAAQERLPSIAEALRPLIDNKVIVALVTDDTAAIEAYSGLQIVQLPVEARTAGPMPLERLEQEVLKRIKT